MFLHISTSRGWMFLSADYIHKKTPPKKQNKTKKTTTQKQKRIGQATSDLCYTRFTYYDKDNQQGCSRRSNWFSLRCLGPCRNHLSPVLWSTFRFWFLIVSRSESLIWWKGIFLCIFCLYSCFAIIFPLKLICSQIAFLCYVRWSDIFHRRSLCSF